MKIKEQYQWIKSSELVSIVTLAACLLACFLTKFKGSAPGLLLGGAFSLINIRLIRFAAGRMVKSGAKLPWSFWAICIGKFYLFAIVLFVLIVIFNLEGLGFMVGFTTPLAVLTIMAIRYYGHSQNHYPILG